MDESESAWPVKSYPCMFCQRGFTSAQALGGHMNVHRKDRAILRQSSSQVYHHAKNLSVPVNFSVPAGAHLPMRSTVGDEDQMASGYNFPISGDRRSKIIPFSQSVGSSRPSLGIQMKEYVFMTSSEDHGSCYRFQDPVGAEKQLRMEGTQSVDLELRLGQQRPD